MDTDNPQRWRECADEARCIAELISDPAVKRRMLEVAERYTRLAQRSERLLEEHARFHKIQAESARFAPGSTAASELWCPRDSDTLAVRPAG